MEGARLSQVPGPRWAFGAPSEGYAGREDEVASIDKTGASTRAVFTDSITACV